MSQWNPMDNDFDKDLGHLKSQIKESLRIISRFIEDDNKSINNHYETYGDLYRRYEDSNGEEQKSEIPHRPVAGQFRLELKSLLECIAIIDQKLGGTKGQVSSESEEEELPDPEEYLEKRKGKKEK